MYFYSFPIISFNSFGLSGRSLRIEIIDLYSSTPEWSFSITRYRKFTSGSLTEAKLYWLDCFYRGIIKVSYFFCSPDASWRLRVGWDSDNSKAGLNTGYFSFSILRRPISSSSSLFSAFSYTLVPNWLTIEMVGTDFTHWPIDLCVSGRFYLSAELFRWVRKDPSFGL